MRIAHRLYNLRRRYFGTWSVEDPRPIQKEAPYTFFLPTTEDITALRPGDLVKLTIKSSPPGIEYDAERMWVILDSRGPKEWQGRLDNSPSDMPQLQAGDQICFQPHHIIDLQFEGEREVPEQIPVRQYWDRCLVDNCVVDDGVPVHYIYREAADLAQKGDRYPDSGWRIRGDYRATSDDDLSKRPMEYIAIGKVLNADDSWLYLIDEPIGCAYIRNFATETYESAD
ncbi:MAG: DUF2185 domain-containing protein [bacterium]|nr:DUF2185 domain-containing protein [bacterium]